MGTEKPPNTLLVKHLPHALSDGEREELLRKFGAQKIKRCSERGALKYAVYAQFTNYDKATAVLRQLHQLELVGKRLSVEYAKKSDIFDDSKPKTDNKLIDNESISTPRVEPELDLNKIAEKINAMSDKWNVAYPLNPKLRYSYPPPSVGILTNIANALASVPRFYVQVLHLMNRLNLPAPFGEITTTPPLPQTIPPPLPEEPEIEVAEMAISSTEESELESEEDSIPKQSSENKQSHREQRQKKRLNRKRPGLLLNPPLQASLKPTSNVSLEDIFEQPSAKLAKKIEIKQVSSTQADEPASTVGLDANGSAMFSGVTLPSVKQEAVERSESGFGKIEPVPKIDIEEAELEEDLDTEFISSRKLRRGRLSTKEMRELSVFKRYEPGEPTSRLYIKNIAKQVTEKDVRYIFGRFVNWEDELEKNMFDIRLMTEGRMKGQAFVSLLSADKAQQALNETHGFEFHGKPLVVQFARSSKPKDNKAETTKEKF